MSQGADRDRSREELFAENLERFIADMDRRLSGMELGRDVVDASYRLEVSRDRMSARLDLFPPLNGGSPLDWLVLVDRLSSEGLRGLLTEEIASAVDRCNSGQVVKDVVVARGTPPVPSEEGRVEILFPLSMEESLDEDQDLPLHLRKVVKVRAVRPGDRLAIFHPPKPGRNGVDVYGEEIPVEDPKDVSLFPGPGVSILEDGRTYVASREGQPVLDGRTLRVDPVFEVRGDVGVSTGNVRFDGSIVVRGNVSEGFSVVAGVDLEVFGGVFNASIQCGRDCVVHGGVVGERASVEAMGSVLLHHLEHGRVISDGPVTVERYSLNGKISSGDRVTVKGNRGVMGGGVIALSTVDVTSAGSPAEVKTLLAVGTSFRVQAQLERLKGELRDVVASIMRAENLVRAVSDRVKDLRSLREDVRERIGKVMALYDGLKRQEGEIKSRIAVLEEMLRSSAQNGLVKVRGEVHPGVVVEVSGVKRYVMEPMRYVSFYLGEDGEVTFGPYR